MNGDVYWLEERASYISGGHCKTDIPEGGEYIYKTEELYCPETGETYVYETWVCS